MLSITYQRFCIGVVFMTPVMRINASLWMLFSCYSIVSILHLGQRTDVTAKSWSWFCLAIGWK